MLAKEDKVSAILATEDILMPNVGNRVGVLWYNEELVLVSGQYCNIIATMQY